MKYINQKTSILGFKKIGPMSQKGFTIIEIIITIAILSFGIVGIYGFFQPADILTSNFSLRLIAGYLAQEGLEIVKNIRDNNILSGNKWSQGFDICGSGCQLDYKTGTVIEAPENELKEYDDNNFLNINGDGFYSYDSGPATRFKRKIVIDEPFSPNEDILKVRVLVEWSYNNKPFSFNTIGYIYNY
jgi:prepilin-type N-terminal cleavage/methylation domain-containing protein